MVQSLTKLNVIDNSGATGAKVIRVLNKKKVGRIGSLVVVTITKNVRNSKIRKGTVHKGIIVRTKVKSKEFNQSLKWFENSMVLVKEKGNDYLPIGSRLKGGIASELRTKIGCNKILALANKVF